MTENIFFQSKNYQDLLHNEEDYALDVYYKEGNYICNKKEWRINGDLHNDKGAAVIIVKKHKYKNKNKTIYKYFMNDILHRENGPAVITDEYEEWWCNGRVHREDGPAIVYKNGGEEWYKYGLLHREDGPAIIKQDYEEWRLNGFLHREDGPAMNYGFGKEWYLNGELHREDGPAVKSQDGKQWWFHGKLHREDGPAVIDYEEGKEEWYNNGFLHRVDGPAIIYDNGNEEWYKYDKLHRGCELPAITINRFNEETQSFVILQEWWGEGKKHRSHNLPASVFNKDKEYYVFDKLHRTDGPAIDNENNKQWWLNDVQMSEDKHKQIVLIWKKYLFNIKKIILDKYKERLNLCFNKDLTINISKFILA